MVCLVAVMRKMVWLMNRLVQAPPFALAQQHPCSAVKFPLRNLGSSPIRNTGLHLNYSEPVLRN